MYVNDLTVKMLEDKRKSMRTSAIVHAIIILLAILPFLKSPLQPSEFKQAVLVEFQRGSSNEGSQKSAPALKEEESSAATEVAEEREVMPETKPIEMSTPPPVLTSKTEPPVIKKSKVRKIEVKTPQPTETIPQQTGVKTVPTPKKDVILKPSKVKKVVIKIEQPTSSGTGTGSGKGKADSKSQDGGNGEGGDGTATSGDGADDGKGKGDKGEGNSDKGDGAEGKGEGDFEGDGILSRRIISNPDLNDIVSESGKMSFNVCVDQSGHVTMVEYNKKHSTIRDKEVIGRTINRAREYMFEVDPTAPTRECGRMTFIIDIKL